MIAVVDYGMGNLRSVSKALERVGAAVQVTSDPRTVEQAEKLILPGVGAFGAAMRELSRRNLVDSVQAAVAQRKPYLGICLGLQLLFDSSDEAPGVPGLGILPGAVKRFSFNSGLRSQVSGLKVPHMGWNQVMTRHETRDMPAPAVTAQGGPGRHETCPLLRGIPEGSYVYFVHSYYADPADPGAVALETDYGIRFASMVWNGNLFATQFHPEKSQAVGLTLLKNFVEL